MSVTPEQLYDLLPAAMRAADQRAGGVLRGIMEVVAERIDDVDADIERMGENWFIETCAPWVVPYIGELLGERPLAGVEGLDTPRARVANAIAYRRRKGTVAVLEALTRDTTGWPTRAQEYFRILAATQHLRNVRLDRPGRVSLRDGDALELLGGPFDTAPHTADVRRIATASALRRGRHNIPNIGLHVYRLVSDWVPRTTARPHVVPGDGRYRADPLGRDRPLFNRARPETAVEDLATEPQVPAPLRRRPLADDLDGLRDDLAAGRTPAPKWFGARPPVRLHRRAAPAAPLLEVPAEQIDVCHLGDLPASTEWRRPLPGRVAVDPVLGRIAFPAGEDPDLVLVSAAHGAVGPIGAGGWDRRADVADLLSRPVTWQVGVSRDIAPVAGVIVGTLGEAVAAWNAQPDGTVGLISVMESALFEEDLTGPNRIEVGEGSLLGLVAADWPTLPVPGGVPGETARRTGRIDPSGVRPTLLGDLEVRGTAPDDSPAAGEFVLEGLMLSGQVRVTSTGGDDLGRITLSHCTLDPAGGGFAVVAGNEHLDVEILRSRVGPVAGAADVPSITIVESVVDGAGGDAIVSLGAALRAEGVTVLGPVRVRQMEASGTLFTEPVTVERAQVGCVRFSYVAPGSLTPRRYRCQPGSAVAAAPDADPVVIRARVRPSFTSTDPVHPAYAQLSMRCPPEIATGAEDGSEMGAYGFLKVPHRVANLMASLDEYLRFGLEAGLIPET